MTEVRIKKGESIDKALRRLKKKLDREGTLREARNRRTFENTTEKKKRKAREARLNFWGTFNLNRPQSAVPAA